MSLKTFRKSGEAVPTAVWFAQEGDKLYVVTQAGSGKVKRIRNNGGVEISPCKANGDVIGEVYHPAQASILADEVQIKTADKTLSSKYGWQKRMFQILWIVGRKPVVYLEITTA